MNIQFDEFINTHGLDPRRLLLALSGGLDSMVLLQLLHEQREMLPTIHAIHIHHQLQTIADEWPLFCEQQCQQRHIPLTVIWVNVEQGSAEGLEAAARKARYAALAELMHAGDVLLTAHHADDQAETLLLQLFRGAGIDGTAAMPLVKPFAGGHQLRPLLPFPREQLQAFAQARGLQWVDDPSNTDASFDRNFLRHDVLPQLLGHWPGLINTLGRVAQNHAETRTVLNQYLQDELTGLMHAGRLHWPSLQHLPRPRQGLLLRHWILQAGHRPPSRKVLTRMQDELFTPREDANPQVAWGGSLVCRYRDYLHIMAQAPVFDASQVLAWEPQDSLSIAGAGTLSMETVEQGGFPRDWVTRPWQVRFRHGGEAVLAADGHHRTLKKLLQGASMPPWQRQRLPLIYCDGELVFIPGIYQAPQYGHQGKGILPAWLPDTSISD